MAINKLDIETKETSITRTGVPTKNMLVADEINKIVGGVNDVIDLVNTLPTNDTGKEIIENVKTEVLKEIVSNFEYIPGGTLQVIGVETNLSCLYLDLDNNTWNQYDNINKTSIVLQTFNKVYCIYKLNNKNIMIADDKIYIFNEDTSWVISDNTDNIYVYIDEQNTISQDKNLNIYINATTLIDGLPKSKIIFVTGLDLKIIIFENGEAWRSINDVWTKLDITNPVDVVYEEVDSLQQYVVITSDNGSYIYDPEINAFVAYQTKEEVGDFLYYSYDEYGRINKACFSVRDKNNTIWRINGYLDPDFGVHNNNYNDDPYFTLQVNTNFISTVRGDDQAITKWTENPMMINNPNWTKIKDSVTIGDEKYWTYRYSPSQTKGKK